MLVKVLISALIIFKVSGKSEELKNVQLPLYLKICRQSDPKLNKCVAQSVEQLRPLLANGIPEFEIPNIEPLIIPTLVIDQGSRGGIYVNSTFTNIKVYGPSKFELKNVKIDLNKNRVRIKLHLPHLQIVSEYEMTGRILMMPISGKGESTGNYTDIDATITMQLERMKRDERSYFNVTSFYVDFKLGHATIQLDNLFNGDKKLGEVMNTFLNENWKNVAGEIKPALEDTIAGLFKKFSNKIFAKYPIDTILPE